MGSPDPVDQNHILILFDGVCNLCNGVVKFIIRRDPTSKFKFASLQSTFGQRQLLRYGLDPNQLHSIIVIENEKVFEQSNAALKIAEHLEGPWSAAKIFKFIPQVMRDWLYNAIAASRYKVFGKSDACMIPDQDLKARFVE